MQQRIATFISYLFHPLLMPSYLLWIVFHTDTYLQLALPQKLQYIIYGLVVITTVLIPVSFSIILLRGGYIKSLHLDTKEERRLPYLLTCIFYFATFYLLKQAQIPSLVTLLFLGATLALLASILINMKWKISAHMVGIGGVIGALAGLSLRLFLNYQVLLLALIILAGIIGTSRMLLKAHSPAQIYSGFCLGLLSQIGFFIWI